MTQSPKPLIVIAEDDKDLAALISTQLDVANMQSQVCHEASHVLRFLKNNFANLLLLDVHLPDDTGFNLIDELRKNGIEVPVIFLTGENAEVQKVKALELGGDDYITKPFGFPELIARINAVLRRAGTSRDTNITQNATTTDEAFGFCGADVNPQRLEVTFPDGETESIGRKELGIFTYLASNPNTVLTRKNLIHSVWGIHADVRSRSLDQYIVKIRDLYKRHGLSLDAFRTVHGVGYIYDTQD
ncbi:response regulator transcription factor [Coraliomargarita akajimensis]|uniref:Two component transcriptional regulator, winged helix family n=1 Tax=Coraliomargarita akajimensis (strain DSM 45221 / IAM 15411 / JCM 23193 / KCTC 12865 / 04OKA010-24) TaxID=583355 RepID=D5ELP0_CORAD|nr:response regulator transcription factor [Coraliomargarita akajimensis]ADE53215.1 two component transcriptional regulator, winged helix family [Coraliomargarita akajimensis DSM 45221]